MKKLFPILFISLIIVIFFWQFFFKGLLPIPSDTVVGLYHPFRDLYAKDYPNGIPFKNFLITDPVRQQYPWRELALSSIGKLEMPLWNSYNFAGTPLLANFQSAPFYFFNILFFLMPFSVAWSLLIILGPLLGGIFTFFYLDNLKLNRWASVLGAITFSFSGFFISWLEWGTITHVVLWLPLVLLSIDKIVPSIKYKVLSIRNRKFFAWSLVYLFSLTSSLFAGHLQTFFYLFVFLSIYFFARLMQVGWQKKILFLFIILNSLFIILTSIQWLPTLQFILLSAREIDQVPWQNPGWYIPWQHLIQFVAPDFFGNPTTLNYWGVWNYGELVGYVGILPIILAIFALIFRHDKKTFFFGAIFFVSLVFSLPTFFAKLPYALNVPFLSTIQPTRLLFVTDFSLVILTSFGLDYFIRSKKREIIYPLIFILFILLGLWGFVVFGNGITKTVSAQDIIVAKRNLFFPTLIFVVSAFLLFVLKGFSNKHKNFAIMTCIIVVAVTVFDLLRFGIKFTPFTNRNYLFPETKTISFLQKNLGNYRIMTTDSRILPPNFSVIYRLQSIDGYDPLYLSRYGEIIAASERGKPDISPPFGFNRIITPHNYDSKIIDLLGVKYVLSLSDLHSPKLKKVFQEGQTKIYENKNVLPRVFFVENVKVGKNKEEILGMMFDREFNPLKTAVVDMPFDVSSNLYSGGKRGEAEIFAYSENSVVIKAESLENGLLVLTDSFYPTWGVKINDIETEIYRTDYNFRGVVVPKGNHTVTFYNSLL